MSNHCQVLLLLEAKREGLSSSATHDTWFTVEATNDYLRLRSYFMPDAAGARVESDDAERTLSPLIA